MKLFGNFDFVMFAIHPPDHWSLLIADLKEKTIKYYDPLPDSHRYAGVKKFADLLTARAALEKKDGYDKWTYSSVPVVFDQQKNRRG